MTAALAAAQAAFFTDDQADAPDAADAFWRAGGPWHTELREERRGVMLHFDASLGSDRDALGWLFDPRCRVSYNDVVSDTGTLHHVAPEGARAWHAGVCRPSDPARLPYRDANSAFYGVAWLGGGRGSDVCPAAAVEGLVRYCVEKFRKHGWSAPETWRIVSHRTEAWERGRKNDPEGARHPAHTVLATEEVRRRVAAALTPAAPQPAPVQPVPVGAPPARIRVPGIAGELVGDISLPGDGA